MTRSRSESFVCMWISPHSETNLTASPSTWGQRCKAMQSNRISVVQDAFAVTDHVSEIIVVYPGILWTTTMFLSKRVTTRGYGLRPQQSRFLQWLSLLFVIMLVLSQSSLLEVLVYKKLGYLCLNSARSVHKIASMSWALFMKNRDFHRTKSYSTVQKVPHPPDS